MLEANYDDENEVFYENVDDWTEWLHEVRRPGCTFNDLSGQGSNLDIDKHYEMDVMLKRGLIRMIEESRHAELATAYIVAQENVEYEITGRQMAWLILDWLRAQRSGSVFGDTGRSHNGGLDPSGGAGATCGDNPAMTGGVGAIDKPKGRVGPLKGILKHSPGKRGSKDVESNKTIEVPIETLVVKSSSQKRNQRRRAAKKMAKSLMETGPAFGGGRGEVSGRAV